MIEAQPALFEVQPTKEELEAEFERLRLEEIERSKAILEISMAKAAILDLLYVQPAPDVDVAFNGR